MPAAEQTLADRPLALVRMQQAERMSPRLVRVREPTPASARMLALVRTSRHRMGQMSRRNLAGQRVPESMCRDRAEVTSKFNLADPAALT
jgi:hypothetical protein